ncbi:RNA polymerase sigma-70 factor [Parabacteroides gordonii]|jgi:RNA polymerase sigma-70 factor (family 1)|uniref:RNA polymerase sigma-70 factor n=1 Tax=Parabacteroides gordonii TaxID=574930 RepID=UPI00241EE783|nr:RNA polymerase sigma-70 factor [Parabacteroides gordonii]
MLSDITDNITDEVLFEKIQAGDVKAFDILFMRYYPLLCAYAKQFVDFDDGQEIVQDVMVWFWENSSMQVIESSPKNYLFRAVKNRCLTLINRNELKQRVVSSMCENQQSQYEDPDFYIVEELTRNIENALSRLPETYREAFEMNRFQSMTYNEIAEKLNVSSKTVDYRIQQALKLLRVELKDYLPLLMALVRIV